MRIKIGGFGQPEQILDVTHFEVLSEDPTRPMFYVYGGKDGVSVLMTDIGRVFITAHLMKTAVIEVIE